jgi:pyruvate formate lyase activating enzyme
MTIPDGGDHVHLFSARWWYSADRERVVCTLCPRYCRIPTGSHGFCFVRQNVEGKLYSSAYGCSTGYAVDPIEKKPLYHFYPGSQILSFGTIGCNLGCKFCQNWHISKVRGQRYVSRRDTPEKVVRMAQDHGCVGIAYTYNDPIIFGEWVMDIAALARTAGLKNVLVTNGYVSSEAREDLYRHVDAANVDLKAFTRDFYRRLTLADLEPVLETLRWLIHETDVWVEITTLLIPGENDGSKELDRLTRFIAEELHRDVPLHFTAFHPDFKLLDHPPTPVETLVRARRIALDNGLRFVYLGNVYSSVGQKTSCPNCGKQVIQRNIYYVFEPRLKGNRCGFCGTVIPGRFSSVPEQAVSQNTG